MGTVAGVTSQLNAIGGCTPARDCCGDIDALKGELIRQSQRMAALEAGNSTAQTALDKATQALNAINPLEQKAARAFDLGMSNQSEIDLLAGVVAGVAVVASEAGKLAGQAFNAIGALGNEIGKALAAAFSGDGEARSLAQRALDLAGQALRSATSADAKATGAASSAATAQRTADGAAGTAATAQRTADGAATTASSAKSIADRAIGAAGAANGKADRALSAAGAASGKADRALSAAGTARSTADRAIQIARDTATRAGAPGRNGRDGKDGIDGKDGTLGKDGTDLKNKVSDLTGKVSTLTTKVKTLEQAKVDTSIAKEILAEVSRARNDIAFLPVALSGSRRFTDALTSAAATGACQSSRPGGCPGGLPDQLNKLTGSILNGIGATSSLLNTQLLMPLAKSLDGITKTVNTINKSVGIPIVGTLSTWAAATAEVANRSQILNILTYISVLHNAYFLSNSLSQTLFSAVSNSLAALGIKDTSTDPAGIPLNIGKIVGDWTEGFFKAAIGAETVNGIKADWKKYSRIYQAAANVMYSMQSIGHSILGAMEVVGSRVAKIGNALQKFRAVGENAFGWMNPQTSFQNRFFTGLQATQEVLSSVDQVSSEVLSVQENIAQLSKNKDDLVKSAGEDPNGKKADPTPEAAKVKAAEDAAKLASKSPDISESDRTKP